MNRTAHTAFFGSLIFAVAFGCGGSGERSGFEEQDDRQEESDPNAGGSQQGSSSGFAGQIGDVVVEPRNAVVVIDTATTPATPGTVGYKVLASGKDVTSTATLKVDDARLGSFNGATFTSAASLPAGALGVSTMVQASVKEGSGLGRLTVIALRKTGAQRDFFFAVPYGKDPAPKNDFLKFSTSIKQVDVVFAMDTTASMAGAINNLKNALAGNLLGELQKAIPSVGLAVVDYKDYPVAPYGEPGSFFSPAKDFPVKVHQKITTAIGSAQTAVGKYQVSGGRDLPESQIPAMQHILTGEALSWSGGSVPAAASASPGHWGAVDFRPGAVPVVVNITDVDWHGEGHQPYSFPTPTMATLKQAFVSKSAFFVNVTCAPGSPNCGSPDESQADELSDATKSNVPPSAFASACGANQCCTGVNGAARAASGPGATCRLNFQHSNGTGVSSGIVRAIEAISVGAAYDVKAVPSNDPKNAKGVDATKFIKALRAMDEGHAASGCPAALAKDADGDGIKETFVGVKVGTPVCFEVIPAQNKTVLPEDQPQFFNAFVDVIGVQGNIQLDKRSVLFLVPPKDPEVH